MTTLQGPGNARSASTSKHSRRQFSLSRVGIAATALLLALATRLPWAVISQSPSPSARSARFQGDLFVVMNHGWRKDLAVVLVVLAVLCGIQALVAPFHRIGFSSSLAGLVALAIVVIGYTQVHTFVGPDLHHPTVSIGYGGYLALGAGVILMLSWAIFPHKLRRSAPASPDPLGCSNRGSDFFSGSSHPGRPKTTRGPALRTLAGQTPGSSEWKHDGVAKRAMSTLPSLDQALVELGRPRAIPNAVEGDRASKAVTHAPAARARQAAGWYPDYSDATAVRYWDGSQWTEHIQPASPR